MIAITADPMTTASHLYQGDLPGPGLRRARILGTALISCAVAVGVTACGTTTADYGGLPSWLPTSTMPVHHVVKASADQPQLGVEGDTMSVILAAGQVNVTVVGPDGTTQGRYPVPATTPCAFVVTFDDAAGSVPINPADFTIVDEMGNVHHPQLSIDGTSPPTHVPAGQPVNLRIDEVLPTGGGQLRWSAGGPAAIASWDFSVEID